MELLLSLIPYLLKALPFLAAGAFYFLFRMEKGKRKTAEEERDNAQDSYQVAEDTGKIKEEGNKVVETIEKADLDKLADLFHTGLRKPGAQD